MLSHPRGMVCPSFPISLSLLENRGRRECRVRAAPAVSCAKVAQLAHTSIQVSGEHSDIPCAMALRLISRSPRWSGLVVTVTHGLLRKLEASIAASGPHDFAVRGQRFVRRQETPDAIRVHRNPTPTFGDDGQRPSSGMRWPSLYSDFRKLKAKYFCSRGLTFLPKIRIDFPDNAGLSACSRDSS
jgi:hypothetical protein